MSKTRELLIDVARRLFAKEGIENTTMNDIAKASNKGRRTLYTYFKNKQDIYMAVIESELNLLADNLRSVERLNMAADDKLVRYIFMRMDAIKETVFKIGRAHV